MSLPYLLIWLRRSHCRPTPEVYHFSPPCKLPRQESGTGGQPVSIIDATRDSVPSHGVTGSYSESEVPSSEMWDTPGVRQVDSH